MRIAFRVDSSNLIGAGHVSRCLKLASDLNKGCKEIIFITKNLKGNFNNLIKKKKFKLVLIKSNKFKRKLDHDLEFTKNICKKFRINTLIVDHYNLGINWEKKIKKHINKLVLIDDFTKRRHYCDLAINNLSNKNLNTAKHLNGLKYVIIPDSFFKKNKKNKKNIRIGSFFGSTDRYNCNERLLKIFSQKEFEKFKFLFILGKNNKNKEKIEKNFEKYKNFYIEKRFINMKNFFKNIDILITVGGVTSFEVLSNNIECIYIPINHYQKMTCNFLKKNKISNVLSYSKVFGKSGKQLLFNTLKKISKEKKLSKKNIYLDNLGSKRIANFILAKEFNKDCFTH